MTFENYKYKIIDDVVWISRVPQLHNVYDITIPLDAFKNIAKDILEMSIENDKWVSFRNKLISIINSNLYDFVVVGDLWENTIYGFHYSKDDDEFTNGSFTISKENYKSCKNNEIYLHCYEHIRISPKTIPAIKLD